MESLGERAAASGMEGLAVAMAEGQAPDDIVLIIHSLGLFALSERGMVREVTDQEWASDIAALKSIHWTVEQSQYVFRPRSEMHNLYVFHVGGLYKLCLHDQSVEQVCTRSWGHLKAACYHPDGSVIAVLTMGIHRVNLEDGSIKKVNGKTWMLTKAAVYASEQNAVVCFSDMGTYKVSLSDGVCRRLNRKAWIRVLGAISVRDSAYVISSDGICAVSLADGAYTKINSESWKAIAHGGAGGLVPLGPVPFVSRD